LSLNLARNECNHTKKNMRTKLKKKNKILNSKSTMKREKMNNEVCIVF
jgi:hypothetical protein